MDLKRTIIAAALMLLTSVFILYFNKIEDKPLKKKLSSFPVQVGEFKGQKIRFDEEIYDILGVDDSISINYLNHNNDSVQLYIGYYQSQRKGDIIHSPKNCMPGNGWNIVESSELTISRNNDDHDQVKLNKLVLEKGIQRQVALYWYYSSGRVIASEYSQKAYLVWDSIVKKRTDGAFVRLMGPVTEKGEHQATEILKKFAGQIFQILNDYIPT